MPYITGWVTLLVSVRKMDKELNRNEIRSQTPGEHAPAKTWIVGLSEHLRDRHRTPFPGELRNELLSDHFNKPPKHSALTRALLRAAFILGSATGVISKPESNSGPQGPGGMD